MSLAGESSEWERNVTDFDSLKSPVSKRLKKKLICQWKMDKFSKIRHKNINSLSWIGKTDRLRFLRLSQKNYSMSREGNERRNKSRNNSSDYRPNEGRNCPRKSSSSEKTVAINEDWGRRTELHNVFHVNDGHNVWNIIRRGIFDNIKFWKNCYGIINCKATGKISVKGISEKSLLEINTEDILRKFLNLSVIQWSALREALDEKNFIFSFNASEEVDLNKLCSLGKLWYFICKRRHFLPNVCVMGKLSGAIKLMNELEIVPKIIVTEIRDFKGEEIC